MKHAVVLYMFDSQMFVGMWVALWSVFGGHRAPMEMLMR